MVIQLISHGVPSINGIISPPKMNTALTLLERVKQCQLSTKKKKKLGLARELSAQFEKLSR
jgi:hypothetical protein